MGSSNDNKVILIGENLNIMSPVYGPALKDKDARTIRELARKEVAAGVDYMDINIGPATKTGADMMAWAVKTVQEVVDKPLSLDTTNPLAIEAGLKAHRGRALINSISLQPDRLSGELPLVVRYDADMIGLLWGTEGMPRDVNERCMLAVDLVYKANQVGIPNERIWLDPIATPVSGDINQVKACFEFLQMLPEIAPGCKTTIGLSNISNGSPAHLRPLLNRTFLMMLHKCGLYSAIVDAFDPELIRIARGKRPELFALVSNMMDGIIPDTSILNEEELQYSKTVKVLLGESLYAHSWLEI
jgi:5-methyltetrahydrofolate corrinoid/iron sulfur protein methyltransferase